MLLHRILFIAIPVLIQSVDSCNSRGETNDGPHGQLLHGTTTRNDHHGTDVPSSHNDGQSQDISPSGRDDSKAQLKHPKTSQRRGLSCEECVLRLKLSSNKVFEDEAVLRQHCGDSSAGPKQTSGTPQHKDDFRHRCSKCQIKCKSWEQLLFYFQPGHQKKTGTPGWWRYCPHGLYGAGPSPFLDELQRHIVFSRHPRRMIDFPAQTIFARDDPQRFQGRRMNLLPVLNSNKLAEKLVSQAVRTRRRENTMQRDQCPDNYRSAMTAWPSMNPTNFQSFGTCVPSPGTSHQRQPNQPASASPISRKRKRGSSRPAKGKSLQDGHKGKSVNSTYDPKRWARLDSNKHIERSKVPKSGPNIEEILGTYEDLWDLELDAFVENQQQDGPLQPEFCFIENNPKSPDFQDIVCIDNGPLDEMVDEEVLATDQSPTVAKSPASTTPPPELTTQWFTTPPRSPDSGPAGLPRGLLPLGGLLCVWSLETDSDTIYEATKSTYIPPLSQAASKMLRFGNTLVNSIGKTLSAYQDMGLLPRLVWRCQALEPRSKRQ